MLSAAYNRPVSGHRNVIHLQIRAKLRWTSCVDSYKMKKYSSSFTIARVVLTLTCVIFFVLQSYQQMDKFFSNMTSVSTRKMKDVEVQIPNMIICLNEPFKSDQYPKTLEDYYNIRNQLNPSD